MDTDQTVSGPEKDQNIHAKCTCISEKPLLMKSEAFLFVTKCNNLTPPIDVVSRNIPASCVVSFCVPTGCYGSPLLSGWTLNGREIFRCHSDVLRPGLTKHAFFSDYSVLPVC
nr:MAG TPA: hypothetical protein [Caudoviricetes sp.]